MALGRVRLEEILGCREEVLGKSEMKVEEKWK